jgi:hypothetical protein
MEKKNFFYEVSNLFLPVPFLKVSSPGSNISHKLTLKQTPQPSPQKEEE